MNTHTQAAPTLDRADVEQVLYRTAICAVTFHPRTQVDDPGYDIEDDVTWCSAPLRGIPAGLIAEVLQVIIRKVITDPTANRRSFVEMLARLAEE